MITNKIDKKITLLWNNIRELYKTYAHLPTTSYWHKPYQMWLGVMFGGNYLAHQVDTTFDLTYKKDKK